MVGNASRTRRTVAASQASRQGTDATGLDDLQGQIFDTATVIEEVEEAPPSSHPRRFDNESPPARQPDDDPIDGLSSPASSKEADDDDEEQLRITFEKLAKQQRIDNYKEKIELMQKGIKISENAIGDSPAVPLVVAREPTGSSFREPTPNLAHIPEYNVHSVKDHNEWEREWRRLHAISPAYYQRDANKVNIAATKLRGPLADAWEREERAAVDSQSITWRTFCDFLLNFIDDPVNRHSTMYRAWRRCTQRADEDLHTYYQRLETIQSEIPELSEDIKTMHLLSTMRPGLRRKLVELQKDTLPRNELLKVGASLERNADSGDNTIGVKKAKTPGADGETPVTTTAPSFKKFKTNEGNSSSRGGKSGFQRPRGDSQANRGGRHFERRGSAPNNIPVGDGKPRDRKPLSEMECYECHKTGHLKPNCPELRKRAAGASKVNHQPKNGETSP